MVMAKKKSEKRKRGHLLGVRLTDAEYKNCLAVAEKRGYSCATFARVAMLEQVYAPEAT
jgi:hypothetical protein